MLQHHKTTCSSWTKMLRNVSGKQTHNRLLQLKTNIFGEVLSAFLRLSPIRLCIIYHLPHYSLWGECVKTKGWCKQGVGWRTGLYKQHILIRNGHQGRIYNRDASRNICEHSSLQLSQLTCAGIQNQEMLQPWHSLSHLKIKPHLKPSTRYLKRFIFMCKSLNRWDSNCTFNQRYQQNIYGY